MPKMVRRPEPFLDEAVKAGLTTSRMLGITKPQLLDSITRPKVDLKKHLKAADQTRDPRYLAHGYILKKIREDYSNFWVRTGNVDRNVPFTPEIIDRTVTSLRFTSKPKDKSEGIGLPIGIPLKLPVTRKNAPPKYILLYVTLPRNVEKARKENPEQFKRFCYALAANVLRKAPQLAGSLAMNETQKRKQRVSAVKKIGETIFKAVNDQMRMQRLRKAVPRIVK